MAAPDLLTIQALRSDVALQIARGLRRLGLNQTTAAKRFAIPQPTFSKITNGRVADLSLELLLRIAVRAGLPLVLQTGRIPEEAGASIESDHPTAAPHAGSKLAAGARDSLSAATRRLTPEQRLDAFLEHSQWVSELHHAGRSAAIARMQKVTSLR